MAVGVLALQGSYNEHIAALRRIGVMGVEVRKPEQLDSLASLIIPGGESTTMAKLAEYHNLFPALREFVKLGKPVWGTCAGLIFLANKAYGQKDGGQELVGGLDCTVHRNFFGSQLQSFETELVVPELASKEGGPETFRGVFIRAPAVLEVGPEVEVLADYSVPASKLPDEYRGPERQKENSTGTSKVIVAIRQKNLLGTAFHPELTADTRWHSYFLKMSTEFVEGSSRTITSVISNPSELIQPRNARPSRVVALLLAMVWFSFFEIDINGGSRNMARKPTATTKNKSHVSNGYISEDDDVVLIAQSSSGSGPEPPNSDPEESSTGNASIAEGEGSGEEESEEEEKVEVVKKKASAKKRKNAGKADAKCLFPMNRIKMIAKSEGGDDLRLSHEAIFLLNKASEKFLELFTEEAYGETVRESKNYVAYHHLSASVSKEQRLCFLSDLIPVKITAGEALRERQLINAEPKAPTTN